MTLGSATTLPASNCSLPARATRRAWAPRRLLGGTRVHMIAAALVAAAAPPTVAQALPPQADGAARVSAAPVEPKFCGTSAAGGYDSLYVTGVSCPAGVRLAVEWRRRAFGGRGRASVRIGGWRCRLTQERSEGSIVRCSQSGDLVAWYPAAPASPLPGFQIDLAGAAGAHLECFVSNARLRCLNYSRATAPGRCAFGGDVPAIELARRGRARITFSCVDEGFHGWERLRAGETFGSGPFRCRASATRGTLLCASTISGSSFAVAANGSAKIRS